MTETQTLAQLKRKYDAEMVSALLGAGFTKNAYGKALSWTELLMDLVEEAYNREMQEMYQQYVHQRFGVEVKTYEEMKAQLVKDIIVKEGYLNVVSRYIEHKGYREAIDYYIETHNPYFYQKSTGLYGVKGDDETELTAKDFTVHQRFLMGKWQYVFTTNFDNALEFTNEQFDMGYLTIKADYEMSRKKMARPIVKIHGSLVPAEQSLDMPFVFDGDQSRRYIISKEDFDTYFKRHEAFSYLLRVAMLSGSYLLLGFSGDDPNFKSWLNWVKDILDKDSGGVKNTEKDNNGERLVSEGEEDIKVFLVLTENEPIPEEQKLYYKNHHIGVIHLDAPEIRAQLGYSDRAPVGHKIDHLLKYIIGTQVDVTDDLQEERPTAAKAWREVSSKVNSKEPITDAVNELKSVLAECKYVKGNTSQEYIVGELYYKKDSLTEDEKEVLPFAMQDVAVPTGVMPDGIKEQMEDRSNWKGMQIREATLEGEGEEVEGDDDFTKQENVLRALYRMDFTTAKELLTKWIPGAGYEIVKASLAYFFTRQDSLKELDVVIMNTKKDSERYAASLMYNCVEGNLVATYPLNQYRNKGLVGMYDVLTYIISEIRKKKEELNVYGTEISYRRMDGSSEDEPDVRRAYRFLNIISREGFNLCYGISNVINVADWYLVFKKMYTQYPYACLYYSSQYNNKKVLRRIGQDFAFEESLKDDLPVMLKQIFNAQACKDTPGTLLPGMLQIGSQMFWGMNEAIWFKNFYEYLTSTFTVEGEQYLHSSDAKSFVGNALVCLHEKEHVSKVVTVLLNLFETMPDTVLGMLIHQTRLDKIDALDDEQTTLIEKMAAEGGLANTAILLNEFNEKGLLAKEVKDTFVRSHVAKMDDVKKSGRYTLFNLCCLAADMPDMVVKLKEVILERNIWDSGVGEQLIEEAQPFFIMHLGKEYIWSIEETAKIYENLKANLSRLTKKRIENTFLEREYKTLLQEMKHFVELYPVADEDVKQDIEEKLAIARHFDKVEDGLYSDDPETVENATKELNALYRDGKFEENRYLFEVLLSKCSMMKSPGISECLVTISVAVHFCGEEVKKDKKLLDMLYRLLLQYKDKDLRDLDLQVIHAGHALLEIAKLLATTDFQDENIEVWLNNSNLTRLNYLEF